MCLDEVAKSHQERNADVAGTWDFRARVHDVLVGTLILDIIDASSNTIVWRGVASKQIDPHAKPETGDKQVNKAVEKLFQHYPGGS